MQERIEHGQCILWQDEWLPNTAIGFVIAGQGSQWPQMGMKLLDEYTTFRETVRYLDQVLLGLSNKPQWTIEQALPEPAATSQVHNAAFPRVCVLQYRSES